MRGCAFGLYHFAILLPERVALDVVHADGVERDIDASRLADNVGGVRFYGLLLERVDNRRLNYAARSRSLVRDRIEF